MAPLLLQQLCTHKMLQPIMFRMGCFRTSPQPTLLGDKVWAALHHCTVQSGAWAVWLPHQGLPGPGLWLWRCYLDVEVWGTFVDHRQHAPLDRIGKDRVPIFAAKYDKQTTSMQPISDGWNQYKYLKCKCYLFIFSVSQMFWNSAKSFPLSTLNIIALWH